MKRNLTLVIMLLLVAVCGFAEKGLERGAGGSNAMGAPIPLTWKQTQDAKYIAYMGKFAVGVRGRVQLNGVTLQATGGAGSQTSSNLPQYFLKTGANLLRLEVPEFVPGKDTRDEALVIDFHALADQGFTEESNRVAHLVIFAKHLKAPFQQDYSFELKPAPVSKLLLSAEPVVAITSEDRRQIENLVIQLLHAYKTVDFDLYLKLLKPAFLDQAEVNHVEMDEHLAPTQKRFPKTAAGFAEVNFDLSQVRLWPALDGRVWFVGNEQGEPFLVVKHGAMPIGLMLGVSKVKGVWGFTRTLGGVEAIPPLEKDLKTAK